MSTVNSGQPIVHSLSTSAQCINRSVITANIAHFQQTKEACRFAEKYSHQKAIKEYLFLCSNNFISFLEREKTLRILTYTVGCR